MTETEATQTLQKLIPCTAQSALQMERAFQTAKQIGSSWPTDHINLLFIDGIAMDGTKGFWRMVIE